MGFAFLLLFAIFAVPVGVYAWYVAVHVPGRGRAQQAVSWRAVADRFGGRFTPSDGTSRFHAISVPFGSALVHVIVFDRAAHDPALSPMHAEVGGWRTFVQAPILDGSGIALSIQPRGWSKAGAPIGCPELERLHVIEPLLGTPQRALAWRLAPIAPIISALGQRYSYVQAGPSFVNLELPGVCTDAALLETAIRVVGALAQPSYVPHQPRPHHAPHAPM